MGVNPRGVEEVAWDVKSKIQVTCGEGKLPCGKGAAGVHLRVREVKVPQNKMRIGKKTKQTLRWYGAIRGVV